VSQFLDGVRALGPWAPAACAGVIVAASLLCVPRWLYTVAAGFACGAAAGMPVALGGAVVGAAIAFGVGRAIGRGWVERRGRESVRAAAIDEAIGDGGFAIVALVRISPVLPCSVMSYLFGASRVSVGRFLAASFVGMIPGTVLYASIGAAAKSLAELWARGEWRSWTGVYAGAGLAVTLAAIAWMTVATQRRLKRRALPSARPAPETPAM